jgi:DNA polymerase-3 subunit epsilon
MNNKNLLTILPEKSGRYVVLDTETTGFEVKVDSLIAISAVELVDGKITGLQFNGFLRKRDKKGENKKKAKNILYFCEDYSSEIFNNEKHIMQNFLRFVGDSIILAHNAPFDFKFIDSELEKWSLPPLPLDRYRCTLLIARSVLKFNTKYSVESLTNHFGFECCKSDFHHGLFDAFMLARIICKLYDIESADKEKQRILRIIEEEELKLRNKTEIYFNESFSIQYSDKEKDDEEIIDFSDNFCSQIDINRAYVFDDDLEKISHEKQSKLKNMMKNFVNNNINK